MSSLYVISAVAKDSPGLVHSLTKILGDLAINIVDIEARSVRGHFLIFMVVDFATSASSYEELVKELAPISANFDLGLRVEPYEEGRRKADKSLVLLTVMGIDRPGIVAALSGICSENGVNIEYIKMIARGEYIVIEIRIDTSDLEDISGYRKALYRFSDSTGLDVALRDGDIFRKPKRVVLFDCDSTVIQEEVIDELARVAGVGEQVRDLTKKSMNGELDFEQAIVKRVSLLKGLTVEQLAMLSKTINLTPGAEELISTLHSMGYKVGVISGGFSFFTNYLKKRLNLDYVFANKLEIENGVVTGRIKGEIIDAERKGRILREIAQLEGITEDQVVAVGDGANDRFMLKNSGLAVAFNPKEVLREFSDGMITNDNLLGLLYFLGVPAQK